jgi:hypothetical protein
VFGAVDIAATRGRPALDAMQGAMIGLHSSGNGFVYESV